MTSYDPDDLSVSAPEKKEFPLAPKGLHPAILVDIFAEPPQEYLGKVKTQIRWVFELKAKDVEGNPFFLAYWTSKTWGSFEGKESKLTELVNVYERRILTLKEKMELKLPKYLGTCVELYVKHKENPEGKMRARITSIDRTEERLKPSGQYKRFVKDEGGPVAHVNKGFDLTEDEPKDSGPGANLRETISRWQNHDNDRVKALVDSLVVKFLESKDSEALADLNEKQLVKLLEQIQQKAEPLLKK